MPPTAKPYHHGDLRAALLTAAIASLEEGEAFSMRSIARRAGVSQTAPYRHFADRSALDSAVAVEGFADLERDLTTALAQLPTDAPPVDVVCTLGVSYVRFALRRPAVFRLMFGHECDPGNSARAEAAGKVHALVGDVVAHHFPESDAAALATAMWGVAHGLAFLHLDGKLRAEPSREVAARVTASIAALLTTHTSSITH